MRYTWNRSPNGNCSDKRHFQERASTQRSLHCAALRSRWQRGGRCFLGKCFSTEESWTLGSPKVTKNGFCQQPPSLEAPPSPLSSRPKRSAVERSLCGCSFLEMFKGGRSGRNPR